MPVRIVGEGGEDPVQTFADMLSRCTGKTVSVGQDGALSRSNGAADPASQPMLDALDRLIASPNKPDMTVRRRARPDDPMVDSFCRRLLILEHIEAFPETPPAGHPSATTRCEVLIHVIAEYAAAFHDGYDQCTDNLGKYHRKGMEAQTALRAAHEQVAATINFQAAGNTLEMRHANGTKTTATRDPKTGRITVDHGPKETAAPLTPRFILPDPPPRDDTLKDLFETSPFIFDGEIEEVGAPPGQWSNFALTYQRVCYRPVAFVRGYLPGARVDVHHLVAEKTASTRRDAPGLDPRVFAPGKRLMVFAEPDSDPLASGAVRLVANFPRHVLAVGANPKRTRK